MKILLPPIKPWRGYRGTDAYGSGVYGASRDGGSRLHMGRDLIAQPKDAVLASYPAKVARIGWVYGDGVLHLVVLEGQGDFKGYTSRLLYVSAILHPGAIVEAGDQIGAAEDVAGWYAKNEPRPGSMVNHVHWELSMPVDPSQFLPPHLQPEIQT